MTFEALYELLDFSLSRHFFCRVGRRRDKNNKIICKSFERSNNHLIFLKKKKTDKIPYLLIWHLKSKDFDRDNFS